MPALPTKKKMVTKVPEDDNRNESVVGDVKKTKNTPLLKELQNASSDKKVVKTRNLRSSDIRTDGDTDASGADKVTKYKKGAVKRGIARTILNKKNQVKRTRSSRRSLSSPPSGSISPSVANMKSNQTASATTSAAPPVCSRIMFWRSSSSLKGSTRSDFEQRTLSNGVFFRVIGEAAWGCTRPLPELLLLKI
jgi:hypothetical protein